MRIAILRKKQKYRVGILNRDDRCKIPFRYAFESEWICLKSKAPEPPLNNAQSSTVSQ